MNPHSTVAAAQARVASADVSTDTQSEQMSGSGKLDTQTGLSIALVLVLLAAAVAWGRQSQRLESVETALSVQSRKIEQLSDLITQLKLELYQSRQRSPQTEVHP